ncbi:interleukin-6 receptor subunit beta isoform X2 [Xiphias gladius]|nr:interleukin-6 receptor subunit beta isoform X2 [Xiphias gladius]
MLNGSLICEVSQESNSHAEPDVSLIVSSMNRILSCDRIFNSVASFNITASIKIYITGTEKRSPPLTFNPSNAVKPSQPVLMVLRSTKDSVVVSWRSTSDNSCRLRYRVNNTLTWSQTSDFVPVSRNQKPVYTIEDLLPFTIYRAAVACREKSGMWSDWSPDVTVRTLAREPSRAPEVCYGVEKTDSGERFYLMWKGLDLHEAGGIILGYQVSYEPVREQHLRHRFTQNVTGWRMILNVEEGTWIVTVAAFNRAGYGPAANLSIDTQRRSYPPPVRNLWVSSSFPTATDLLVQWEIPTAPPVTRFEVQWHPETHPSASRWSTVDGYTSSTVIQDVDRDESYVIRVFPVYEQQCGSPRSMSASLLQGALVEAVRLKAVNVTKTLVTAVWAWQNKSWPIRVNRYAVTLKENSGGQTLSVWPDQQRHTFTNLKPGTEYSLLLLADNESRHIVSVRTHFDEVPVVATVTPLLLIALTVGIICILSRTVYKSYFFPPISSPWCSTAGQWAMDPNHQKFAERNILDITDFQVPDILREKSVIAVEPKTLPSSEEDVHEDSSLLPPSHLVVKLSALRLDTEYVSDSPVTAAHQPQSHHPDRVSMSEEGREADAALLPKINQANSRFPQKEEENWRLRHCQTSHQSAVKCHFHELVANADSPCVCGMTSDAQYVLNSSFQGKMDVETETEVTGCSYLICEGDYIANSCFTAKTADEDGDIVSIAC